jgi:hypothetical protein
VLAVGLPDSALGERYFEAMADDVADLLGAIAAPILLVREGRGASRAQREAGRVRGGGEGWLRDADTWAYCRETAMG